MGSINWLKQTSAEPLFADLLWSRPENKRARGKLLIIGGNAHSFTAVSQSYAAAQAAGAGSLRIMLPDALAKSLGKVFPEAEFAPSTPSGSFARSALASLLDASSWADAVLLAGDFGRNSETAVALETFLEKYRGPLCITGDSLDYFLAKSPALLDRPATTIVANLAQLQKLLAGKILIKHSMELMTLVEALSGYEHAASLICEHNGQYLVVSGGQISTMPAHADLLTTASHAVVWQLQQAAKPFEALTTAVYCANSG